MVDMVFLHPHLLKTGGATNVVLEQAARLNKMGLSSVILTTKQDRKLVNTYRGVKVIEIGKLSTMNLRYWLGFPMFLYMLSKTISELNPRIIYCHSLAIYWGSAYKFFHKKKTVINYYHDLGFPYTDSNYEIVGLPFIQQLLVRLTLPLFIIYNRWIIKNTDFLIANSLATSKFLEHKYKRKADLIITPGIDSKIFKPYKYCKKKVIYTVGRLDKIKNIDLIIRGFGEYINTHPKNIFTLKVIGDGRERRKLAALVEKLQIEKWVKFLGTKSGREIAQVAQTAILGIFMCTHESFGMSVVETMACGVPVIGARRNGIQDNVIHRKTGLLIEPNTYDIGQAIRNITDNPGLRDRMAIAAAKHAKEKYNWEKQMDIFHKWIFNIIT